MFSEPEFWVAVAFVILMAVFAWFGIHRTVLKALDHRSERIKAELDDARRLKEEAAKLIGAGIACIGMGGAGVGVGVIFGQYLSAALRNPSAAQGQFANLIFGFAVTEALGIFSLLIALLLLFAL